MDKRYGARGTETGGIFFTEDAIVGVRSLKKISVEISRQNSSLTEIKKAMAAQAQQVGANAVMNFKYGQKSHSWLQLIALKWDTESWYGEGDAVSANEAA